MPQGCWFPKIQSQVHEAAHPGSFWKMRLSWFKVSLAHCLPVHPHPCTLTPAPSPLRCIRAANPHLFSAWQSSKPILEQRCVPVRAVLALRAQRPLCAQRGLCMGAVLKIHGCNNILKWLTGVWASSHGQWNSNYALWRQAFRRSDSAVTSRVT